MRLATAVAMLGMALVLVGAGTTSADARRGRYDGAGQRVQRSSKGISHRHARRLVRERKGAALKLKRGKAFIAAAPPADRPIVAATSVAEVVETSVALAVQAVPPPPGPSLVHTVTYDFERGTKTTSLRDGSLFVEAFDPNVFFRMAPDTAPSTTSSTLVLASPAVP